jgi:riboflavin synthase alpha subunit
MFTGIIEEVGRIRAIERQAVSARLTVAASKVLSDAGRCWKAARSETVSQ